MERTTGAIKVPAITKPRHRYAVLPNGATVIAIEDPTASMSAAAMTMKVGSLCDPVEFPGLAHFTEHMLFMGTEKFPQEDEYDKFVSSNGGQSNAWTADRATTYYFTIAEQALFGGLERFVEFFAAPMFSASCVEREVQAVHSEDEKNHSVDYWRLDEVLRTLFHPDHPRFRYGNGNAQTLWEAPRAKGLDVRQALLAFYVKHYVAPAACLAVYSKHPLEAILAVVEPALLRMRPAAGLPVAFSYLPAAPTPLADGALGSVLCIKTVKKLISVRMVWSIKTSQADRVRTAPAAYASHVLGHECNASILAALKAESLAASLMCSAGQGLDDDFDRFMIEIGLTKKGFGQLDRVLDTIYAGIAVLRRPGQVDGATQAQMVREDELHFALDDVKQPSMHCTTLTDGALTYGPEMAWYGSMCTLEGNAAASFRLIQEQLVPSMCIVIFMWSDFDTDGTVAGEPQAAATDEEEEEEDKEEGDAVLSASMLPTYFNTTTWQTAPIHGSRYALGRIPDSVLQRWEGLANGTLRGDYAARLGLPPPNPFIATDFTVHAQPPEEPEAPPTPIATPYGTFYVKADPGRHNVPKSGVAVTMVSAVPYSTPLNRFLSRVAALILKDRLTEMLYCAELASIENSIGLSEGGFGIDVLGPSEKVLDLCVALLDQCTRRGVLEPTAEKFASYCDIATRSLQSMRMQQPYEVAQAVVRSHTCAVYYMFEEILAAAAAGASREAYVAFVDAFLASPLRLEGTVFGNIVSVADVARGFCAQVTALLAGKGVPPMTDALAANVPRYRDVFLMLPSAQPDRWVLDERDAFNPSDPNTAVVACFGVGAESAAVRAVSDVLGKLIQSEFFSALRTTEAIGYVVSSGASRTGRCATLSLIVQSAIPSITALYLLSRIVAFVDYIEDTLLPAWTEAALASVKEALERRRLDPPKSTQQELSRLEDERLHPLQFQRRPLEVEAIRSVTLDAVRAFFVRCMSNRAGGAKRRLAVVLARAGSTPLLPAAVGGDGAGTVQHATLPLLRQGLEQAVDVKLPTFEAEASRRPLTFQRVSRLDTQDELLRHASF